MAATVTKTKTPADKKKLLTKHRRRVEENKKFSELEKVVAAFVGAPSVMCTCRLSDLQLCRIRPFKSHRSQICLYRILRSVVILHSYSLRWPADIVFGRFEESVLHEADGHSDKKHTTCPQRSRHTWRRTHRKWKDSCVPCTRT